LDFTNNSSAGSAVITNDLNLTFGGGSTAETATIDTTAGAKTVFKVSSNGGTAQLITDAGGTTDFSAAKGPNNDHRLSVGSIAGAGTYHLGADQLTVGSGDVSGLIDGTGGSMVKVGPGTLTLSHTGNSHERVRDRDARGAGAARERPRPVALQRKAPHVRPMMRVVVVGKRLAAARTAGKQQLL
jgi:hypothetical protein